MKKPARFLRILGVAGLLIGLLAAMVAPTAAQDDDDLSQAWLDALVGVDGAGFLSGYNAIYYPWVANGEDFDLGPSQTMISIQNLENRDTLISVYVGNGAGQYLLAAEAYLTAYASKTFSADDLGIAAGSGAPVKVMSFNEASIYGFPAALGVPAGAFDDVPHGAILVETPVILSNPIAADDDGGESTQVVACVVNFHIAAQPNFGHPWGYVAATDHTFIAEEADEDEALTTGNWLGHAYTQQELQATLNAANAGSPDQLINPFGGLNNDGDCFDVVEPAAYTFNDGVAIGGVAKQTAARAPVDDDDESRVLQPVTTTDISVSGYNAINGIEMAAFHQWYLPIVQTNGGPGGKWNSIIRVANLNFTNNAVTARFFPNEEDGSGSLKTGFQLQKLVNGGATWSIDLSEEDVPPDWTGSVHILSDGAVFAMVDRYKAATNMWITNTGSSADFEVVAQVPNANGRFALFAPHVLMDYYGWNTGINVANLVDADNNVSIQYFNTLGNATEVLNQRIAPHGMTYFYDPSFPAQDNNSQNESTDPDAGVVGSAIIWSEHPVAAAVDGVKYAGHGLSAGQATSYNATANVFPWQAVPYVTRGDATDGSGATSGINIMNPNAVAATTNVYWVNPSGFQADNFGTSSVTIPAFANGFVYTLWQHNLPNGFEGAAQVVSTVPVAAVSANVNYGVAGDGSAIFNAFNPCGFYRVGGPCSFGDALQPGGQSITKTFVDENGDGVAGVTFSIASTSGAAYQREATSGVGGSARLTNVPVGTYDLTVLGVPADFVPPAGAQESIVVAEGKDVVVTNELEWAQGFTKTVCVAGPAPDPGMAEPVGCSGTNLVGVSVIVYENIGADPLGAPVAGDIVFEGVTGPDGTIGSNLAPGNYILCMYDEDGVARTTNGEPVTVALPDQVYAAARCATEVAGPVGLGRYGDLFTVTAGQHVSLANPVAVTNGVINVFVGTQGNTTGATLENHARNLNGVKGIEVCIDVTDLVSNGLVTKCAVTGEDGSVTIIVDAPAVIPTTPYGIGVNAYSGQYSKQYGLVCVEGGGLTAIPTSQIPLCAGYDPPHLAGDVSASLQQQRTDLAGFSALYSPSDDIAQDGYLDDGPGTGTWDLVIQVEPL